MISKISGENIHIYDCENRLIYSLIAIETLFYRSRYYVITQTQTRRNIVLEYSNEIVAQNALNILLQQKQEIIENMMFDINNPKEGNIMIYKNGSWTNSKTTIKES